MSDGWRARLGRWLLGNAEAMPPVWLVGGTVRDLLLGKEPGDLDIVCHGAKSLAAALARAKNAALVPMEKDSRAPSYRVVSRQDPDDYLDVTELRGPDMDSDLRARDFSVNAMALEIRPEAPGLTGETLDPCGGQEALSARRLEILGEQNILDDPLRIMRGYRLAGTLGFTLSPGTLELFTRHAALLTQVAMERVTRELLLLLDSGRAAPLVRMMDAQGVLAVLFPETLPMRGCVQEGFHHLDVWEHSLLVFEECGKILGALETEFGEDGAGVRAYLGESRRRPLLLLAALLHDIGKPMAKRTNAEKGRATFYGHDRKGAALVEETARGMRLSAKDREYLALLVREHIHVLDLAKPHVREKTRMAWFRSMGGAAAASLVLALADIRGRRGPFVTEKDTREREDYCHAMIHALYGGVLERLREKPFVTGQDLLDLGMAPGPRMRKALEKVREAQDAGEVTDREAALALARELAASPSAS
jgi:putative nucleotidyltransferase with HDIG domain